MDNRITMDKLHLTLIPSAGNTQLSSYLPADSFIHAAPVWRAIFMDQIADDTVLNSFWLRCPWTPGSQLSLCQCRWMTRSLQSQFELSLIFPLRLCSFFWFIHFACSITNTLAMIQAFVEKYCQLRFQCAAEIFQTPWDMPLAMARISVIRDESSQRLSPSESCILLCVPISIPV